MGKPWHHQCNRDGCYRDQHVLDFNRPGSDGRSMNDLMPRNIGFADIDATVEYNHQFLEMEWKTSRDAFNKAKGHNYYCTRKTSGHRRAAALRLTYFQVVGDIRSMSVSEFRIIYPGGKDGGWTEGTWEDLAGKIEAWHAYVDRAP
jgi:hypothetical protein